VREDLCGYEEECLLLRQSSPGITAATLAEYRGVCFVVLTADFVSMLQDYLASPHYINCNRRPKNPSKTGKCNGLAKLVGICFLALAPENV
jgi:hypothetical protein